METLTKPGKPRRKSLPKPLHDGEKMTLEKYLNWESEDGFKYEWDNETLIAVKGMKSTERMTVSRLTRKFSLTRAYQNGDELLPEPDTFFKAVNKLRIPNLAFFTRQQLLDSEKGAEAVPAFVIEILSQSNTAGEMETKRLDYFFSGVQTVWEIFPKQKMVKVYSSSKLVQICTDGDLCSAAPAVADFQISVHDIFYS
jgi:Uma2 family endonuclease